MSDSCRIRAYSEGLAHGSLDDKTANVLPSLLEERDEEVDGQHDVGDKLVDSEVNVSDGNGETKDLLQLEFDGRSDLCELCCHVIGVGERSWELSSLGKTWSKQTRNLLD